MIVTFLPLTFFGLFYSFSQKSTSMTSLSFIETLPVNHATISRQKAKLNLNQSINQVSRGRQHVLETNAGRKIDNTIFDQIWYKNREVFLTKHRL